MTVSASGRVMPGSPPILELDRVRVIRDAAVVLDDISLRIETGGHTAIIGPNGCGKSTLVKLITRELYPVACPGGGGMRLFGAARWDVAELRSRMGIVSADLHRDLAGASMLSALDAVVCGHFASQRLPQHRVVTRSMIDAALDALHRVGIHQLAARRVTTLSTGEMRRVLIARALVHRPSALLLDEPTTGLDVVVRDQLLHSLSVLARSGTTLLLVTHHAEEIVDEIGRVLLMRDGRVVADGLPGDVLTDANVSAAFAAPLRVRRLARGHAIEPATQSGAD